VEADDKLRLRTEREPMQERVILAILARNTVLLTWQRLNGNLNSTANEPRIRRDGSGIYAAQDAPGLWAVEALLKWLVECKLNRSLKSQFLFTSSSFFVYVFGVIWKA
jgi:hypothetical protein